MAEFSNPNQQGGGQESKSLLAMMVLFFAVLLGLQFYHSKLSPEAAKPAGKQQPEAAQKAAAAPPVAATQTPAPVAGAPAGPAVEATSQVTSVVENDLFRITFTNRGAQVTSWVLKGKQFTDSNGKPLDLVHREAAEKFGYPLSLYTTDPSIANALNQAMFVPSATGVESAPASITFKYSGGGLEATKTFTFDKTYVLHASVSVTHNGAQVPAYIAWPGGFGDQNDDPRGGAYANAQVDYLQNGNLTHTDAKKVTSGASISGPFDWAGTSDPFFAAIFLPDSPGSASAISFNHQMDVSKIITRVGFGSSSPPTKALDMPIVGAAVGDTSGPTETRLFVGPKAINVLKSVHAADPHVTLEPVLEFGFWGFIGKYLFLALQFLHSHLTASWSGSWGWAIIILTVLINVIMLPFRVKTMKSALEMQRIQPQIEGIKQKYKNPKMNDPKYSEMNQEIMAFQKEHNVNMFGGCIPTLITFPFLMAFFYMLPKVVELRHAHWFWLPDLQAADPYHILPIVMIVSQFLMQFYTPSPGVDPQQQKMMAFMMPAFSGYICWNYASGLAMYWTIGNLIGIAQQLVMNRTSLGREMRELAAKRARRKGQTIQARR